MERLRLLAVVGCAAFVSFGLALGAVAQHEEHLQPDLESLRQSSGSAAGDPIPLTGLLVVVGAVGLLVLLGRDAVRRRVPELAVAAVTLYALVNLVQTGWPTLVDVQSATQRIATLRINLFLFDGPGIASVFVAVVGSALAGLLALRWSVRRLLGRHDADATLLDLLRRHIGWHSLSLPLSAVAAMGAVALVGDVPDDQVFARVLLPALAAALLGLEGLGLAKLWHLGRASRDARWAPVSDEALQGLARAERVVAATVLGLALLGFLMPRLAIPSLQPGYTFGVNLQNHAVFLAFALVPHAPRLLDRRLRETLLRLPPVPGAGPQPAVLWLAYAGAAAVVAGAAIGVWVVPGALWPWAIAATLAVVVGAAGRRSAAAIALLVAALAWWGLGNTLAASFDAAQGSRLDRAVSSDLLALARLAALVFASAAAALVARRLAGPERPAIAIPLSAVLALGVAVLGLLDFPLEIWVVNRFAGVSVAQGSLLAAQDAAVQVSMHVVTLLGACAAALATARLVRPEWFARRPARPLRRPTGAPTAS